MFEQPKPWEGDNLGREDMAIPEIKLVQYVGGDLAKQSGAKPGDFYCSLTDETLQEFDLVIVSMQKNRTYWGRSDILDEPPECASLDARSMLSLNGDNCADCEYRSETPWLLTTEERRKKCLINYNIVGIKLPEQMPVILRSSGISAQSAKELYTQLVLNRQLGGAWYKAKTHVTSVPKKSSAGDAFAIRFSKLELLPENTLSETRNLSQQLLGTQVALPEGREEVPVLAEVKTPVAKVPPKKKPSGTKIEEEPPVEEQPIDVDF